MEKKSTTLPNALNQRNAGSGKTGLEIAYPPSPIHTYELMCTLWRTEHKGQWTTDRDANQLGFLE